MHVRMMEQILPPGMEHRNHSCLSAKMLWISTDGAHRLRGRLEQDIVDHRLVLQGNRGDLRRHGEHNVEVRDRKQFRLPVEEPLGPSQALAFWAVSVSARVVGDACIATIGALLDVAAEDRRSTSLDRAHHAALSV
jgi:hypothetical protein